MKLAKPVDGAEVYIDPTAGCGVLIDSSLADYTLQVSTDNGASFTTVADGTFDRQSLYRLNRVPSSGVPNGVTHVRLIAHSTQGSFPNAPIGDLGILDIAELQVYGRESAPPGGGGGGGTGGGGGGGPAGVAQLKPDLARVKSRTHVSKKRASFRLRCVQATPGTLPSTCRVTVWLAGTAGGKAMSKRTFSLKPGVFTTVRLTIKAGDRRKLRRHSILTRLRAEVANPGGPRRASKAVRILR